MTLTPYKETPRCELLKTYITRKGSIYQPKVYEKNELPFEILSSPSYFRVISDNAVIKTTRLSLPSDPVDMSPLYSKDQGATKITKLRPQVTTVIEPKPSVPVVAVTESKSVVKEQNYTPDGSSKILINVISKEGLVELKGIGAKTADLIIEAREASPFQNITDLKDRIELKFGDWDAFDISFKVPE